MNAKGYLIDLDGTLLSGNHLLPDAKWLLEQVKGRFMLVSNNAEHTPQQLSRRLKRLGLNVDAGHIVLAGTAAIERLASDLPGAGLLLIGSPALQRYARNKGLVLTNHRPDAVLVTRDRHFSYRKIALAAEAIRQGAALYVAAPDLSHPGPNGEPIPETGALAAAIISCAGYCEATVIGKPEPALFEMACARLNILPEQAMMIGDNPQTDGLGATRLNMAFRHVINGQIREPVAELTE